MQYLKGAIYKTWDFLYYWSDLTEVLTQHVKSKKKHFLFLKSYPFRALFFIYIDKYIYIYIYIWNNRTSSVFVLE